SADETVFVQLRDASRANEVQRVFEFAGRLPADFDIPSYVEYFKLRAQIYDERGELRADTPDDQIRAFLERWKGEAIADRLRNDWLLALGERGDVERFEEQYPLFVLKDDPQVTCWAQTFRARRLAPGATAAMRDWMFDEAQR